LKIWISLFSFYRLVTIALGSAGLTDYLDRETFVLNFLFAKRLALDAALDIMKKDLPLNLLL